MGVFSHPPPKPRRNYFLLMVFFSYPLSPPRSTRFVHACWDTPGAKVPLGTHKIDLSLIPALALHLFFVAPLQFEFLDPPLCIFRQPHAEPKQTPQFRVLSSRFFFFPFHSSPRLPAPLKKELCGWLSKTPIRFPPFFGL